MKRKLKTVTCVIFTAAWALAAHQAAAQYAVEAVSYDAGTNPAVEFGSGLTFTLTSSALGEPSRFINDPNFPSVVSPFSSPYKRSQLLSVGESGHVTLRLSNYALPQPGGKEIGVFTHVSLFDADFPNGVAGDPGFAFGIDRAIVELSEDGSSWTSLDEIVFNVPTNGYLDVTDPFATAAGSVPSDFQQPFAGNLDDFTGLKHSDASAPDILELLAGSGGGNWLDIPAGLAQVGFIRFSVPDNAAADMNFELDAVSIARAAVGAPTVPEPASWSLLILAVCSSMRHAHRRTTYRH